MQRADIDGVQLEYEVSGTGDPIVFIHGAFIADSFRPLTSEPVLTNQFQLITYRRRGYGGSSDNRPKTPISAARQAADCAGLLRYLGLERVHVVGHSFGGSMALQLALDSPQLVRSLALLEPALFVGPSAQSYRESLLRSAERAHVEGVGMVTEEFLRARWPGNAREALDRVVPEAFAQALVDAPTTLEMDIGLTDWVFGELEAHRITQPSLVVLGGNSGRLHPRFEETYRLLLDWLPHAEGLVVPGATHLLQLENAEIAGRLASALAAFFLARNASRASLNS